MACIAIRCNDAYRTAKLLGAAAALRDLSGLQYSSDEGVAEAAAEARRNLGPEANERASADGGHLSLEGAIAFALDT
jgi:hypothetical protein